MIKSIKNFLFPSEKRSGVIATGNLSIYDDFWYGIGGSDTSSGVLVSKESAMRQWAVYSCITEISQTLAQLPLKLKRPDNAGGTEDAKDHPLYVLCKDLPNKLMTSFSFREAQQANLLTTGNCYSHIGRNSLGSIVGIWPIDPNSVIARAASNADISRFKLRKNDRIVYDVQTDRGRITYQSKDILHIVGFGFSGLTGESVITNFAKESIGNAISLDKFQGAGMKNGVHPSGVLEHPDSLGDTKEAFLAALTARYASPENAKRPMVLENGMKWSKADVSFVDKQFIEQMKMTASQICGIFKVPPHRIGIYEKNTNYNNTEQGNKAFLDGCMQQWVVRWEQAMNWKLLSESERLAGYFFKFNFDALLRPDAKTRSEIAWREWQSGVPLNVIRKKNDENPIEGGDVSFVPVNMIPSHLAGLQQQQQADAKDKVVGEDIDNLKSLEKNAITREAKRQKRGRADKEFNLFLDDFYERLFEKIDNRTRLILRCFHDELTVNRIILSLKQEFEEKREKLRTIGDYDDIEDFFNG